jgi:dTDP-4-dehydrorhamnose 3,5-epimerase
MSQSHESLSLIPGRRHVDARGTVSFVNGFDFQSVDRFYWVKPGRASVRRGWVGHRRERKWFSVVHGEVSRAVVQPDNWEQPSADLPVARYRVSATKPQVFHVPSGFATGWTNLDQHAVLLIFYSGKVADAKPMNSDFRWTTGRFDLEAVANYFQCCSAIEELSQTQSPIILNAVAGGSDFRTPRIRYKLASP